MIDPPGTENLPWALPDVTERIKWRECKPQNSQLLLTNAYPGSKKHLFALIYHHLQKSKGKGFPESVLSA